MHRCSLEITTFDQLPISAEIIRAIQDKGFEEATPIQAAAIPCILEGRDLLGQAQTGTGKTCAFGIPVVEQVDLDDNHIQYLVLSPTRELAIQIADEMHDLTKYKEGIRILSVYGGQPIDRQILALKKKPQVIVGTPGRVMDHMRRRTIRLDNLRGIILDEADEMLNMGFKEDIDTILAETPAKIQKTFFSATMPPTILELTNKYLKDPIHVRITPKELTVSNIEQFYIEVRESNKIEVLCRLIEANQIKLALIFCNMKVRVDEICEKLQTRGYAAEALHGDMKQQSRTRVMNKFKKGEVELLVATDVAARGIDVDNIEFVINYDLPQDEEYYVHRIGRTGRAGRSGKAYTFVVGREIIELKNIQRYAHSNIIAAKPPTLMDVTGSKVTSILEEAAESLNATDLAQYVEYIEKFVEGLNVAGSTTQYYTSADVAAAMLRRAMGEHFHKAAEIEPIVPYEELLSRRAAARPARPVRSGRGDDFKKSLMQGANPQSDDVDEYQAERKKRSKALEPGMARLFINTGKDDKIQPRHIVEAICRNSNLKGHQIGAIAIYGRYTFVDVPRDNADEVVEGLTNQRIGQRVVRAERSEGEIPGRMTKTDRPAAPRKYVTGKEKSDRYSKRK